MAGIGAARANSCMADASMMYPRRVARESRSETRRARAVNESVRKVNNRYRARRATRRLDYVARVVD